MALVWRVYAVSLGQAQKGNAMRINEIKQYFDGIEFCIKEMTIEEDQQYIKNEALLRMANLRDFLVNEQIVVDGKKMTNAQRDRLWELCRQYNVPFREDDYRIQTEAIFGSPAGWVEGWVGGINHSAGMGSAQTIYVGVDPEGNSHS